MFIAIFALNVLAGSYVMELPRYSQECFKEILKHGDRMEIGYDVIQSTGDDKLDVTVYNPDNSNLHSVTQERSTAFGFYAGQEGTYQICFFNKLSSADKSVSFSITAPDEQVVVKTSADFSAEEKDLAKEIQDLSNNLRFLKDEQVHMVGLSSRHKQSSRL